MRLALTVAMAGRDSVDNTVDVIVDCDDQATVGSLAGQIGTALGSSAEGLWLGTTRLADTAQIGETALRNGSVVALTPTAGQPFSDPPTSGWLLHVVDGPTAGRTIALSPGRHVLGRDSLHSSDRTVSRRHAALTVAPDRVTVADLGSVNGTSVDGRPVPRESDGPPDGISVGPDELLRLGDTLTRLTRARPADASVEPAGDGGLELNRPPRLLPSPRPTIVEFPVEPQPQEHRRLPLVAALAPLAVGVAMALLLHQVIYLAFAALSPVMVIGNVISDRRQGAMRNRRAKADYAAALRSAHERLSAAHLAEIRQRRRDHPDAAEVIRAATLPTRRLWERRRDDPDALALRLGLAELPSQVRVTGGPAAGSDRLPGLVPATVGLRAVGVLGLAAPAGIAPGVGRWLVAQLAVHHSPRDFRLTLLSARSEEWGFLRWLPHGAPDDPDTASVLVGNDEETIAARTAELAALIRTRQQPGRPPDPVAFRARVVLLDGARKLRGVPGMLTVLRDGPPVGIYSICVDRDERLLPAECKATVIVDPERDDRLCLRLAGDEPIVGIRCEQLAPALAMTVARALAPMRDAGGDGDAGLPIEVRLLDLLRLTPPTAAEIRDRWRRSGSTPRLPIGAGADGDLVLDLDRDGPHGLIAGTTGSGKSELLQTLVASLAVGQRPDELNLMLIDYKGGSAFKDCVGLPHTVGLVTDLDDHLVERALSSLAAELKQRERRLASAGVKDLVDYDLLRRRQPELPAVPRLVLVVDEFASLARELPDFVTGLVGVAQRGRSQGIHLLLATQRPGGVVSPEIRANTNLRIGLRMTGIADSTDVLDAPDAARVPKAIPGRGVARLGHGELVAFQAARVGGRPPGATGPVQAPWVAPLSWARLGRPPPSPPGASSDDTGCTDLSALVAAVREAASMEQIQVQPSPWLPPLPERLFVDQLPECGGDGDLPAIGYALADRPDRQQQPPVGFDLARDGHLLVVGSARSGRSQLLRTIATTAADRIGCDRLHIYGLDCGNGALLPLAELPHTGAVVGRADTERVGRLLQRLTTELSRRQALLAGGGYADITEQRRAGSPLPHLLVLIDRWEGFTSALGDVDYGRLTDDVLTLLREGASVGLHLLISGDRSLAAGRINSLVDTKLVLRLADRADYALLGLNPRSLPRSMPPGRAVLVESGVELQVALLPGDPTGAGQAGAIATVATRTRTRDGGVPQGLRPFRVDALPARISFDDMWQLLPVAAPGRACLAPVGVGGDEMVALGPDLATTPCFVIAGPAGSGRSTALAVVVRSALRAGAIAVLGTPRPSAVRDLAELDGVIDVFADADGEERLWRQAIDKAAGDRPVVIALDDAEAFRDGAAGELFRSVAKGRHPACSLVVAGHPDGLSAGLSGWTHEIRRAGKGMLLSPRSTGDGDLIGVRIPRSVTTDLVRPGRGWLHLGDGRLVAVTVSWD